MTHGKTLQKQFFKKYCHDEKDEKSISYKNCC